MVLLLVSQQGCREEEEEDPGRGGLIRLASALCLSGGVVVQFVVVLRGKERRQDLYHHSCSYLSLPVISHAWRLEAAVCRNFLLSCVNWFLFPWLLLRPPPSCSGEALGRWSAGMAADNSRNGQPLPALAGAGGGGKEFGQAGDGKHENFPSDVTMDRATVDMATAIDKCLLFRDRRKGHLVSETKEAPMSPHGGGAASSFCPGQGSSTLVSLSPPSSPSSQRQKFSYNSNGGGESSSMLKKLEGTPTLLSSLDGPLFVEEGLVDSLGTGSTVEGKTENEEDVRFQELLQTGSSMEALLASRFRAPMAPLSSALQTGRGFPARGGDATCLHRQTQETLEDINTAENETGGNFHQQEELSPLKALQQQQQGASVPNSRIPMQHFHIPENFRMPDKLHRKRAKVLPFLT